MPTASDKRTHSRNQRPPKWVRKLQLIILLPAASFFLLNLLFPLKVAVPWSTLVMDDEGEVLYAFLSEDEKWRMFTTLDEISPELQKALIAKEDRYFMYHPGINPMAVGRALYNNLRTGRRTSGASTISMQVARMLYPAERTYGNKLVEMFRALQIEMLYSKKEVLQWYLNLVPYGGNIEGVKAASLLYLDKNPRDLSLAEITALCVIPNRPTSLRPGSNNSELIETRDKWLRRFASEKVFPLSTIDDALVEPLQMNRRQAPRNAPHLANRVRQKSANQPLVNTSITASSQLKVQTIVSNHHKRLARLGIYNCTAIVIENETAEVKAYVGSADFFNQQDGGQVDGLRALRSPGSALKPFLYAMAMDSGLLTPATVLLDVPIDMGGYRPVNYDHSYQGKVAASEALAKSLNVPAVKLLDEIGAEEFRTKLASAGLQSMIDQRGKLGLSLSLGGCGIRSTELAELYLSLASEGLHRSIRYTPTTDQETGLDTCRLFSPGASFAITEILTQLQRPDLPRGFEYAVNLPRVAWKTGTSYGRRDAWSAGFNTKYTVVVWAGNFSGVGVPELTGADVATPLLFDIFQALDLSSGKQWFRPPDDLQYRYVCPETGLPPRSHCPYQVMDTYLPLISSNKKCDHLRTAYIAVDSSATYCMSCLPEENYIATQFEHHPPELLHWMTLEGTEIEKLPTHNASCQRVFANEQPKITSPTDELDYYVYKAGNQQIELAAQVAEDVEEIFWYVNDRLLASGPPETPVFFAPQAGTVKISCSDDKGRHEDISIQVKHF